MAQNIIYSPAVPYVGSIPGVVAPGFTVIIKGTAHPNCSRFGINLQCGSNISPRDDVLLHIGVDFIRGCVVRNSIHSNNWGPEENQQGHFPFIRGAQFSVTIVCETSHYNIAINGQHFAPFEHRIVYHRASHFTIDGDVILESIEYRSGSQSGFYPAAPGMVPNIQPGYPPAPTSLPYPATPVMMPTPTAAPAPYPPYPASATPYGPTPAAAMMGTAYGGAQPHLPHSPHHGVPGVHHPSTHGHNRGVVGGLLNKIGAGGIAATAATAATAGLGYVGGKKAWKAQKKARKKALKFGIPLAGAGLGAYALSKAWSSSSSSSSSDEE